MYNTPRFKTIIPAGKIILKYLYKPTFINSYRYKQLNDHELIIGRLNLIQLNYVNVDENNSIEINRLGMEVADQLIDEDKKYYLPIFISFFSLSASIVALILSIIFRG